MANVTENGLLSYINSRTGMATGPRPASRPALNPRLAEQYSQLQQQASTAKSTPGIAGNNGLMEYINRVSNTSIPKPKKLNAAQKVLSNKAVKTALMPLQVLDIPRRTIVSGFKELYDTASGEGGASLKDFGKQIANPTFGVGDFVDTGNKWQDRILGFVGDVALDPTTYATLGAGRFAGLTGKLALVSELGVKGGAEDLLRRAGARGLAGLTDAERVAYNLPRAGLYVAGGRLPSTGRIGGALEEGLAAINQGLAKSKVGTAFRNARVDEGTKEIATGLRTGKFTGGMDARKSAAVLNMRNVRAGVTGRTLAEIDQELVPVIDEIRNFGDTTELTHLLEAGDLSNPVLQNTRTWLDNTRQRLLDAGVPEDEVGYIVNYVPHVHTDEMFSILSKETPFAKSYREQTGVSVNELRAPSLTKSRGMFQPDVEYIIGGKVLKFKTGSIKEVNEVFAREFPELAGKKVLRDDLDALLTGYGAQVAQGVGAKAGADSLVTFGDDIGRVSADAMVDVADIDANKVLVGKLEESAKAAGKKNTDLRAQLKAKYKDIGKGVETFLNTRKAVLNTEQAALKTEFDAISAAGFAEAKDLQSQLADIEQFSLRAQKELDDAIAENSRAAVDAEAVGSVINADNPIIKAANDRLESAQHFVDQISIIKAELQDTIKQLDNIKLPRISDLPQEVQAALRKTTNVTGDVPIDDVTMQLHNISGKMKNSQPHVRKAFQQFLNRFAGSAKVVENVSAKVSRGLQQLRDFDDEVVRQLEIFKDYAPRDLATGAVGRKTKQLEELMNNRSVFLEDLSDMRQRIARESRVPTEAESAYIELATKNIADLEKQIEPLYFQSVDVPTQEVIDGLAKQRQALVAKIKETARQDMKAYLDGIPVDYETKVQIAEQFQRHVDIHIQSGALKDRIINKVNLDDNTARSLATEAEAANRSLDASTRQLRLTIDFTQRYKNVVEAIRTNAEAYAIAGLPPMKYNKAHIESLVAKEVLVSETKRLKEVRRGLLNILDTIATEQADGTVSSAAQRLGLDQVDAATEKAAKLSSTNKRRILSSNAADDMKARTNLVEGLMENIRDRRKQINAIAAEGKTRVDEVNVRYGIEAGYADDADYAGNFFYKNRVAESADLSALNKEDFDLITQLLFGDGPLPEGWSISFIEKEILKGNKVDSQKVMKLVQTRFETVLTDPVTGKARTVLNTPPSAKALKAKLNEPAGLVDGQRFLDAQVAAIWEEITNNTRMIRDLDRRSAALGRQFSGDHLYDVTNAPARIDILEKELPKLNAEKKEITKTILPEIGKERAALARRTGPMEFSDAGMPQELKERLTRLKYERQNRANLIAGDPFQTNKRYGSMSDIDNEIELLQELDDLFGKLKTFKGEKNKAFVRTQIAEHPMMQGKVGSDELEFMIKREQEFRARLVEIDRTLKSHGDELSYLKGFSSAPTGPSGRGVIQADWQEVMFGKGSVSRAKLNFRARTELEIVKAELERKLSLQNAGEVKSRIETIRAASKNARGKKVVNAEIKTIKQEISDLEKQLALPKPDNVMPIVHGKNQSIIRKKIAKAQERLAALDAEKGLKESSGAEIKLLEEQLNGGAEKSAQAELAAAREASNNLNGDVLTANRRLEDAQSQIDNKNLQDLSTFDDKTRALMEQKKSVEAQLSTTYNLSKGNNEAYDIARARLQEQLKNINDAMAEAMAVPKLRDASGKSVSNVQFLDEGRVWLDEAQALTDPAKYWATVHGQDLANAPADVVANLVREANITARAYWGGPNVADQYALLGLQASSPERDALLVMIQEAHALEAQLTLSTMAQANFNTMIQSAKSNSLGAVVKQQIMDGWTDIAKTGVAVPKEINDAMTRVLRLDRPDEWSKFWDSWNRYTDVFKAYATLSPRFHIRNGMSATFMNFADGVAFTDMKKGVNYWREFRNDPKGWLNKIPKEEQQLALQAVDAVFASGGGRYSDFQIGTRGTKNRVVAKSRQIGTSVEGFVRMGMALDTIRAGGSVNEAAARITRVHFNYSQVSTVDAQVRKVIPFWTFMSRNIPLQVQQMWTKPRAYQIYNSFVRNFAGAPNGDVVPDYYGDQGAFKSPVGSGYIVPDLPFTKIGQDIQDIASPTKLLASSNPLLKGPAEFISGKNFFTGAPNSTEMKELTGPMSALAPLLNMLGEGATGAGGQNMATARSQQLLRSLTPLLNTGERLSGTGATDPATQMQNILNFFIASPYKNIPQGAQEGDLYARERLINELLAKQKQLGFTPDRGRGL